MCLAMINFSLIWNFKTLSWKTATFKFWLFWHFKFKHKLCMTQTKEFQMIWYQRPKKYTLKNCILICWILFELLRWTQFWVYSNLLNKSVTEVFVSGCNKDFCLISWVICFWLLVMFLLSVFYRRFNCENPFTSKDFTCIFVVKIW